MISKHEIRSRVLDILTLIERLEHSNTGDGGLLAKRAVQLLERRLLEELELENDGVNGVIKWFKAAKPAPTTEDASIQIGCHYEEIAEMQEALMRGTHLRNHLINYADLYKGKTQSAVRNVQFMKEQPKRAAELLDALCDQIVTAVGVGYMLGFDMAGALSEVNASNWSKFDENGNPIFNENGKIVKGENYFKPDLAKFLKAGENE